LLQILKLFVRARAAKATLFRGLWNDEHELAEAAAKFLVHNDPHDGDEELETDAAKQDHTNAWKQAVSEKVGEGDVLHKAILDFVCKNHLFKHEDLGTDKYEEAATWLVHVVCALCMCMCSS